MKTTVWLTRNALSKGIIEVEADVRENGSIVYEDNGFLRRESVEGRYWHRYKFHAEERVKVMKQNKIKSLYNQIKKIKRLNRTQQ